MRALGRVWLACIAAGLACDDGPTGSDDDGGLEFRHIATVPVGDFPTGLALSPDGEWLAVTGESDGMFVLLEADTYEEVGRVDGLGLPRGLAFSNDGDLLVVAERLGFSRGFSVPDLEERFKVSFTAVEALTDRNGGGFFFSGRIGDVIRTDDEGVETARFAVDPVRMAVSRSGEFLFVASEFPDDRIYTLNASSLDIVDEQPLPFWLGEGVLVPLGSGRVKVIGTFRPSSGIPSRPALSLMYDPATGQLSETDTIATSQEPLITGGGSPYVIVEDLTLVPISHGVIVLDGETGDVVEVLGIERFPESTLASPCCDAVYDERRGRLIFTRFWADEIIVYEISGL